MERSFGPRIGQNACNTIQVKILMRPNPRLHQTLSSRRPNGPEQFESSSEPAGLSLLSHISRIACPTIMAKENHIRFYLIYAQEFLQLGERGRKNDKATRSDNSRIQWKHILTAKKRQPRAEMLILQNISVIEDFEKG